MSVYLHNLRLTSHQNPLLDPKLSQSARNSAGNAENEYPHAKKKWIASMDDSIAAQRAIVGSKNEKDDDQEYLEQLEEQRTQTLAIDPDSATTDLPKLHYTDLSSERVVELWNSSFCLRQAYMMYDCLSSMIVIEENLTIST